MLKIKVQEKGKGLHSSEVIVAVQTAGGEVELVVDRRSIRNNMLDVGYPVGTRDDDYLVELPRETVSGHWRVWVPKAAAIKEGAKELAE